MPRLPRHRTEVLADKLKRASRGRREGLADLAQARGSQGARRNDLLPPMKFVYRPIGELWPPKLNVRKPSPAQQARLVASIAHFGFRVPVLIQPDGMIIAGVECVEAARQLGMTELPCVQHDDLTDVEARILRITLNRLGELGEWDGLNSTIEFGGIIDLGHSLEVTGFSGPQIDQIVLGEPQPCEAGPVEPDPVLPQLSQLGDVFRLGDHRVICGDARDPEVYSRLLAREAARLVLTDVPYNVRIPGHVSSGRHPNFVMASGELTEEQFGGLCQPKLHHWVSPLI
jgi:hypothetical protein